MGALSSDLLGTAAETKEPAQPDLSLPETKLETVQETVDTGVGVSSGSLSRELLGSQEDERANLSVLMGQDKQPERSARVLKMQMKTGIPKTVIENNLEQIEKDSALDDFNAEEYRKKSPAMVSWLAEHPDHAAIARDDLENLSMVERILYTPRHAVTSTLEQMELAELRFSQLSGGVLNESQTNRLEQLRAWQKASAQEAEGDNSLEWFVRQVMQGGTQSIIGLAKSTERGLGGAVAGAAAAAVGGPATWPMAPAMALTGWGIGTASGMMEHTYMLEAGMAYDEFLDIKGVNGESIDPQVAMIAAHAVGAANAPVELLGLGAIARSIPGGKKVLAAITRDSVAEMLKRPTVVAALKEVAKRMADAGFSNAVQEGIQEATVIIGGEIAKDMSAGQFKSATASENAERILESMKGGFAMGIGLGAPGQVFQLKRDLQGVKDAKQREAMFTALGDTVSNSKAFQRLPESVKKIVENATKDGPKESVSIPAQDWNTYWQSQQKDPRVMAAQFGVDMGIYDEAFQTAGDIRIKTDVYATQIAPTPAGKELNKDVRFNESEMTAREADRVLKEMQKVSEELKAGKEETVQAVEQIRQQLVDTGLSPTDAEANARLFKAFGEKGSRLLGKSVQAVLENRLRVERPFPEVLMSKEQGLDVLLDKLRAGEIPSEAEVTGPSLLESIARAGGISEEGALAGRDLQKARRGVVSKRGRSMEEMAKQMASEGYIKNPADLLEAIDRELAGTPVYSEGRRDQLTHDTRVALDELDTYLRNLGVDLQTMDNDQVRELIQVAEKMADGHTIFDQIVFHATPHVFDKFDLQKIGTGEGNQVYAWGLYFASAQAVSDRYYELFKKTHGTARLLKVNLVPAEEEYIDFDRPFSKQSDLVKERLRPMLDWLKSARGVKEETIASWRGEQIYENAAFYAQRHGGTALLREETGSRYLASIGIPGIRYLDQESRAKASTVGESQYKVTTPDGVSKTFDRKVLADQEAKATPGAVVEKVPSGLTYNYVIFDDQLANIEEVMYQEQPKGSTIKDARSAMREMVKERPNMKVSWQGQEMTAQELLDMSQDMVKMAKEDAKLFQMAVKCLGG